MNTLLLSDKELCILHDVLSCEEVHGDINVKTFKVACNKIAKADNLMHERRKKAKQRVVNRR